VVAAVVLGSGMTVVGSVPSWAAGAPAMTDLGTLPGDILSAAGGGVAAVANVPSPDGIQGTGHRRAAARPDGIQGSG
jgi:hypothetical protein